MSIWKKIKSYLPGLSRSFWTVYDEMNKRTDEIESQLQVIQDTINELKANVVDGGNDVKQLVLENNKINENLLSEINKIKEQQEIHAEHEQLRFDALFKSIYPDLTPLELRCKIFSLYPDAEGDLRLMQRANARLMHELDKICKKLGITYWFSYGSLVAILSRSDSIPWDDDIDVCMLRDDIDKLIKSLKDNKDYQITICYDWYVKCKQVRFSSRDANNPCFIDIAIHDWTVTVSKDADDYLRNQRIMAMEELTALDERLSYWRENPYLFHPDSGYVVQYGFVDKESQEPTKALEVITEIEGIFSKYKKKAISDGVISDKQMGGIAYSIENIYDNPKRKIIFSTDTILPTKYHEYDKWKFMIPNDAISVANECYPGWPYLPQDILGHEHFNKNILKDEIVRSTLKKFSEDDQ